MPQYANQMTCTFTFLASQSATHGMRRKNNWRRKNETVPFSPLTHQSSNLPGGKEKIDGFQTAIGSQSRVYANRVAVLKD